MVDLKVGDIIKITTYKGMFPTMYDEIISVDGKLRIKDKNGDYPLSILDNLLEGETVTVVGNVKV